MQLYEIKVSLKSILAKSKIGLKYGAVFAEQGRGIGRIELG